MSTIHIFQKATFIIKHDLKSIIFAIDILNLMMKKQSTFREYDKAKFFRTLNKRVNSYFKENKLSKELVTGNYIPKLLIMFSRIFNVPFILILTVPMPQWVLLFLN